MARMSKQPTYDLPGIGTRGGKLSVTGYILKNGNNTVIVRCDCNQLEYAVNTQNFRTGKSTQCSFCAQAASALRKRWVYDDTMPTSQSKRLLGRLAGQISRCHKPSNTHFKHYGGRGISVCPEWREDRGSFLRYVKTLPGWDNPELEIDRIEVNGNYEPGNIQFVTRKSNLQNKRKISDLEQRIRELEACLRSCQCGATASLYDSHGGGAFTCS